MLKEFKKIKESNVIKVTKHLYDSDFARAIYARSKDDLGYPIDNYLYNYKEEWFLCLECNLIPVKFNHHGGGYVEYYIKKDRR